MINTQELTLAGYLLSRKYGKFSLANAELERAYELATEQGFRLDRDEFFDAARNVYDEYIRRRERGELESANRFLRTPVRSLIPAVNYHHV